ncbi:amidase family protein [Streptomyces erythrochromogenes]
MGVSFATGASARTAVRAGPGRSAEAIHGRWTPVAPWRPGRASPCTAAGRRGPRGRTRPLTAAAQAATAAVNPRINAVVESWPAEDAPAPGSTPLAGVPFLIKDRAVSMRGKRVELGSRLAAGNVARQDSFLMRRFRRAGLVTLGRTATPEFGSQGLRVAPYRTGSVVVL